MFNSRAKINISSLNGQFVILLLALFYGSSITAIVLSRDFYFRLFNDVTGTFYPVRRLL